MHQLLWQLQYVLVNVAVRFIKLQTGASVTLHKVRVFILHIRWVCAVVVILIRHVVNVGSPVLIVEHLDVALFFYVLTTFI